MTTTSLTIQAVLKRLQNDHPNIVAFRIKRDGAYIEYTGRQVVDRAESIGAHLYGLGLKAGDRVGLLSENRPEWGVAYLAIVCHGFTVVPLDARLKPQEIQNILGNSGASAIIVSDGFYQDIEGIQPEVPNLKHILTLEEMINVENTDQSLEPISIEPDDLAALIYTSGTTGQPKGVMLSHRNIMSNVVSCSQSISYTQGDNFLSILPLHHTFECTAGFLAPIYDGASVTYVGSFKSRDIIDGIKETKATIMLSVPLFFEKMYAGILRNVKGQPAHVRTIFNVMMGVVKGADKLGIKLGPKIFHGLREKGGFSSIRFFVSGAAALPVEVSEGFERLGMQILQGYGLTESSPVISVNRFDAPKKDTVGPPIPGVEVKIVQPDETGIGEVAVRGDNVMQGYYQNEEATEEVLKDGWLHTGDSGWIDDDGHLHIAGRLKNVIVTKAGKNIYPEEIEDEIVQSPYVAEVLVVGDVDENSGEESVRSIVVPDYEYFKETIDGVPADDDVLKIITKEVRSRCENLSDYKRVKTIEIRKEEFPKTSTQKIKRFLLNKKPPPSTT